MSCRICDHAVSSTAQKKNQASICHTCRSSEQLTDVTLVRLANGEVHLSLNPDEDPGTEIEKIVETIPAQLAKSDLAMILDIDHRARTNSDDFDAADLLRLVLDAIPTMVTRAVARKPTEPVVEELQPAT